MAKKDSPESRLTEGLGLSNTQRAELEARLKLRCQGCRHLIVELKRKPEVKYPTDSDPAPWEDGQKPERWAKEY